MFEKIIESTGLPKPQPEYRFHPSRQWRFDYAWPDHKVALEVEGGIFGRKNSRGHNTVGAHSSVSGMLRDIEKYNEAALLGWKIFRVIPGDLIKLKILELLKQALTQ